MSTARISRNDPCPCGSGRKFKHCCLQQSNRLSASDGFSVHTDSPPPQPSPLRPNRRVKAFVHESREWKETQLKNVPIGVEFIAFNRLFKVLEPDVYAENAILDVSKIPEADRPYNPHNCRTPKSHDVVYAFGENGEPPSHCLLGNLNSGQRCIFQGLVYYIKPGPTSGTCILVGNGEVDERPDGRLYVWLDYTIDDLLGRAKVSYRYPQGRRIPLADGTMLPVESMTAGMVFQLELGGVATVTQVAQPEPWPRNRGFQDPHGNVFRRVVGTFEFTGWVQLMTIAVGGEVHRLTPGHPYWSETRQGWYPISSFRVGELLLTKEKLPIPIEAITPPQWVHETVYNIEVDEYHTYFVGKGKTSVWVHNGLGGAGCGVPTAADPAKPGKKLVRYGTAPETVEKLASDAAAALANPQVGIHGVSAFYRNSVPSAAEFAAVAAEFKIYKTLGKGHYTIELPSPVTQQVADAFNRVFGRIP
jgi:SEC-C motif/Pretoxin HINT domain